jgi:hypothetical protein
MNGYHLRSPLPSEECSRLLLGVLSRRRDDLRPYATAMIGTVDPPHFRFLEFRGLWNPFVPFCYGTITGAASGSTIDGRIHLSIGLSLLLVVPIAFLLAFVPLEAMGGQLEKWFGVMLLLVSASFAVLSVIVSRRQKARYLMFLASIL